MEQHGGGGRGGILPRQLPEFSPRWASRWGHEHLRCIWRWWWCSIIRVTFMFSTISNQRFLYIYDLWEHYIYYHTCSVPINRNFASGSRMILIKVITFLEFRFLKIMQVLEVFHQPKRYSKHSNKSISQFSFNKTSALGHRSASESEHQSLTHSRRRLRRAGGERRPS